MKSILGVNIVEASKWSPKLQKVIAKRGKKESKYIQEFATFDIETSTIPEIKQGFMYIWMMYIGGEVVIGRTWQEFRDVCFKLSNFLVNDTMVIYVHNLSYEFCYLSGIYNFQNDDVMAVKSRKVLRAKIFNNLELRCSYLLSNMSLASYTEKMMVKHRKLVGELDYSIVRTPSDKLKKRELEYCVNDVVGLHEAITTEMSIENDNIATIPLTSTGYIRRDTRKVMYKYRGLIQRIFPTYELYKLLREAFRGGDTHANRYYAGYIINEVESDDISSSYPNELCNSLYPMTPFKNIGEISVSELNDQIYKYNRACLFKVVLAGVSLRDELDGNPYLSFDKCRGVVDYSLDNGRILSAEMLETSVTDIDWKIITKQYFIERIAIKCCYTSEYRYLPKEFRDLICKYYTAKTELKDVEGQELYYGKSKNKINAGYGMMAQNPVKPDILYDGGEWNVDKETSEQQLLEEYKKNAFLVYQWGVWTTARAREALREGIRLAGYRFVYCDTDCVKSLKGLTGVEKFNTSRMLMSEQNGAFAKSPDGKTHYMGVYEHETTYKQFITFGAKKYAGIKEKKGKDTLEITIAGVSKVEGAKELERKGGLKALSKNFKFEESGGKTLIYNDDKYGWYKVKGEDVYITRNCIIVDDKYTLTMTKEYDILLSRCKEISEHLLKNY